MSSNQLHKIVVPLTHSSLYSGEPTKLFLTKFATVLYRSLFHARGDSTSLSLLNVENIRRVDAIGLLH